MSLQGEGLKRSPGFSRFKPGLLQCKTSLCSLDPYQGKLLFMLGSRIAASGPRQEAHPLKPFNNTRHGAYPSSLKHKRKPKRKSSLFQFYFNQMHFVTFQIIHPWFSLSLFQGRLISLLTRESLASHCSHAVVLNQVEGTFLLQVKADAGLKKWPVSKSPLR